jgi:hypothetical protein
VDKCLPAGAKPLMLLAHFFVVADPGERIFDGSTRGAAKPGTRQPAFLWKLSSTAKVSHILEDQNSNRIEPPEKRRRGWD